MKSNSPKELPRILTYRSYNNFDKNKFENELADKFGKEELKSLDYDSFKNNFLRILNKHAPVKKKFLRANHCSFVNKELSKAILLRSQYRNRYLKTKSESDKIKYNKQRNVCVSILRKSKKAYYKNLDLTDKFKGKKFWNAVKPLFGDKVKSRPSITLVEGSKIITKKKRNC